MKKGRLLWVLFLLAPVQAHGQRHGYRREIVKMPTIHSWISLTGDGSLPGSWDTGVPPAVAATGVLTLTGQPLNGEQVVLDAKTYTFQDALTDVDGNVHISHVDASGSLDNLIAAITLGAGAGTAYASSMTLHPTVTAAAGAGDTMDVTAKSRGTSGNSIVSTETLTNGSFGGATLSAGTKWTNDDTAYINKDNGGVAWSSGLDWSDIEGSVGPKLHVESNWNLNFGASGSPLRLPFSEVINKGTGTAYLNCYAATSTAIIMNSFGGLIVLGLTGLSSTYHPIVVNAGDVIIQGGASVTVDSIWLTGSNARIEITNSAIDLSGDVHIRDGSAHIVPAIQSFRTVEVTGGFLDLLGRVASSGHISVTGGVMKYRPIDVTPTIPDLYVDGGILDLSKSLIQLTSADFGTTIIGPRGMVVGGALTRNAVWPPSYDLSKEEWP